MSLKDLHEKYGDAVEFVVIYVREAHASGGWWLGRSRTQRFVHRLSGNPARLDVEEPTTLAERRDVGGRCGSDLLGDSVPLYDDDMSNSTGEAYAANPTRIYFIDRDGRVIYNPGIGPYSFNPTHLEPVIEDYLAGG